MSGKAVVLALLALMVTAATSAQEYGRDSGGLITATVKHSNDFSGSLGLTMGNSSLFFPGKSYGGSVGGALVKDKAWFFATGQLSEATTMAKVAGPTSLPPAAFGSLQAVSDRQAFASTLSRSSATPFALPSNFLTMHYTAVVSPNSYFSASVSKSSSRP